LPEQWKEFITVPIYRKGDKRHCSNYRGKSLLSTTYKILSNILLSRLTPYAEKIIGIISVNIDITGQLLIIYSVFIKYLRENGNAMRQCISYCVADALPHFRLQANLWIQLGGSSCIKF